MSGFLLVTGSLAKGAAEGALAEKLAASMAMRGRDARRRHVAEGVTVLAVRHSWEDAVSGGGNIAVRENCVVACDASIYYQRDLLQRLRTRGIDVPAASPAELIAAAFELWGADCVDWLEGDFAFALWDSRNRRVVAARDPFGLRAAFHANAGGGIVVASSPFPIRLLLGDPQLNRSDLLRSLIGYHGDGTGSSWVGISELPAGWRLSALPGAAGSAERYWYPRRVAEWSRASSADAAVLLRELVADATLQRMPAGGAAVGMSGGRDSTAIVGSVESRRRAPGAGVSLPEFSVLSYRYPEGDPGNEDRYLNSVSRALDLEISWVNTDDIPVFRGMIDRAERRVRPEAQPFEGVNRALAAAARERGVRVLLNGNGGDNLFGVGDQWLSDLLRTGRWVRLTRELRARGNPGRAWMLATCVRPAIPLWMLDIGESVRGRRILSRPWEMHPPPWIKAGLRESEWIAAADRAGFRREIALRETSWERRMRLWALLYAGFARNCAALFDMTLDEGVELKMPLYDLRIANFAWSRGAEDLNDGREHKIVLRNAMSGVLPAEVVAPRPQRTGTSESYFRRRALLEFPEFAGALSDSPLIAEFGLSDGVVLRRHIKMWESAGQRQQLFMLIACAVESWLRAWK